MINSILERVAADPSKNAKIAILKEHQDNELLRGVLVAALDPTIKYFIKKIPTYNNQQLNGNTKTLEWALVELKQLSSRIVTGQAGISHLKNIIESVSASDAAVVVKIIEGDFRAGFSESTVNKVWIGLIPDFPYMRCALPKAVNLDEFSWEQGVYSQLKADSMFANVNHTTDGDVQLLSRNGTQFPLEEFEYLVQDVKDTFPTNTQTHGELMVKRDGVVLPRQIGNGILNSVAKGGTFDKGDKPFYVVWDQIALDAVIPKGTYNVPYSERFAALESQVSGSIFLELIPTRIVHSMEEALTHYREMLAEGLEGTIIKDARGIWKDTTSKHQVKLKLEVSVDLEIVGFNAGNGKNTDTFGSIIARSSDGMLEVNVSGFIDKHPVDKKGKEVREPGVFTRKEIIAMMDQLMNSIMTVDSNSIMPPTKSNPKYSLFLPRFTEFRTDKSDADSLEKIIQQFESAVK